MTRRLLPVAAFALAVFASCAPKGVGNRPTIQYVRDIIAGNGLPETGIVEAFDAASSAGPVCIVGTGSDCAAFRSVFEHCDLLDNVTGRPRPDGLPDFSGEIILSLADDSRGPLCGIEPDSLRMMTVRDVVAAIDTVYYLSEFDKVGLGKRPSSKVVVLASPEMTAYGRFDADTLFEAFGKPDPVISPLGLMLEKVFSTSDEPMNVGILCDTTAVGVRALNDAFDDFVRYGNGSEGSVLYVSGVPSDSTRVLMSYLDTYVASGYTKPLSALIVLGDAADMSGMRREFSEISVPLSDAFLAYGSVLSPSFEVLGDRETAALECLAALRATNRFTHNIHYPKTSFLKTVEAGDGSIILMTDVQKQH